jgi:hypothetical protein
MEKEPLSLRLKLKVAAAIDFPAASEILVSFPDKWELIYQMRRRDTPLYIAAMSPSKESPRCTFGLSDNCREACERRLPVSYTVIPEQEIVS